MNFVIKQPVPNQAYNDNWFIAPDAKLNLPKVGDVFPIGHRDDFLFGTVIAVEFGGIVVHVDEGRLNLNLGLSRGKLALYPTFMIHNHDYAEDGRMVIKSLSIIEGLFGPKKEEKA